MINNREYHVVKKENKGVCMYVYICAHPHTSMCMCLHVYANIDIINTYTLRRTPAYKHTCILITRVCLVSINPETRGQNPSNKEAAKYKIFYSLHIPTLVHTHTGTHTNKTYSTIRFLLYETSGLTWTFNMRSVSSSLQCNFPYNAKQKNFSRTYKGNITIFELLTIYTKQMSSYQ